MLLYSRTLVDGAWYDDVELRMKIGLVRLVRLVRLVVRLVSIL